MEFEAKDPVAAYRQAVNPFRHDVIRAKGWPELFTGADGLYVTGPGGRRYLDLLAQNGGATLGHRHPRVVEALTGVIRSGSPFLVPIGVPSASGELAVRLCRLADAALERTYFCTGGAEAVENAMKFAMAATGRQAFVAFGEGFHGFTPGTLPLAGHDYWRRPLPHWAPEGRHRVPFGDVAALEKVLAADDVAAVFVETVQGLGGARVWDPAALREVADLCRAHGALLVCDEILTGIGRTGRWFGFQHSGVEPDIVTVSKGLSGGIVPVAAVLMTERVHRSIYKSIASAYIHNSTFEGHLLGMTAGLTVLDVIEEEGLLERVERIGSLLRSRLADLIAEDIGVREVRGLGLLLGIRIEGLNAPDAPDGAAACVDLLIERGVLLESAGHAQNWLRLTPPLTLDEESVEVFVAALRGSSLALAARR